MLDQLISWLHANGQFVATAIAIITPILPTMIVKVINDKKLSQTLQSIRNTEDLKRVINEDLKDKVYLFPGY